MQGAAFIAFARTYKFPCPSFCLGVYLQPLFLRPPATISQASRGTLSRWGCFAAAAAREERSTPARAADIRRMCVNHDSSVTQLLFLSLPPFSPFALPVPLFGAFIPSLTAETSWCCASETHQKWPHSVPDPARQVETADFPPPPPPPPPSAPVSLSLS